MDNRAFPDGPSTAPDAATRARITFVLTSCGRFDLLEETLASLVATNDYPIERYLIVEDSGDDAVLKMRERFPELDLEIHINRPHLGQMRSIDKAYAMVATPFVFHCEDDWRFTRRGIVAESVAVLEAFPDVVMVWPRGDGAGSAEQGPEWLRRTPVSTHAGISYRAIDPAAHHRWGTFTFNPGLRRMADYRLLPGGYTATGGEGATSLAYKRLGFRMVLLEEGGVSHIGKGRSTLEQPSRNPLKRLGRSINTRLSHFLWVEGLGRTE